MGPHEIRTLRIPRAPDEPVVEVDLIEWPVESAPVTAPAGDGAGGDVLEVREVSPRRSSNGRSPAS
jgi:hypothetical protein